MPDRRFQHCAVALFVLASIAAAGIGLAVLRDYPAMQDASKPAFNDMLIIYSVALSHLIGALFLFFRHRTMAGFLLTIDILSSATSLTSNGILTLPDISLSHDSLHAMLGFLSTANLGFLANLHFLLHFPRKKHILDRLPKWVLPASYSTVLLQSMLIYAGVTPYVSSTPVTLVLNIMMVAALIHSFATEKDFFLKLQAGFLLLVVVFGFIIIYVFYLLAPLFGLAPLSTAQLALMMLTSLFAFGAMLENTALYQQKLAADEKSRTEKEHLRREFHDDVLGRLATISLLSDAALRASTEAATPVHDRIAAIKTEASTYSRYARGLLWITDDNCSWDDFCARLRQYGYDFFASHDLNFELVTSGNSAAASAPLPVKACLYKVFIEALVNTLKHAQASEVRVCIELSESEVVCRYHDNGKGFDCAATKAGHYGLMHMRRRANDVGGELDIASISGAGTSLTLRIPI